MSLYNSAFEPIAGLGPGKSKILYWWDMIVELIFYTDLMLSFFQAFKCPERNEVVNEFYIIA